MTKKKKKRIKRKKKSKKEGDRGACGIVRGEREKKNSLFSLRSMEIRS